MLITGAWQNEYGSLMQLREAPDGLIQGIYSSTTGATGTYPMLGWAAKNTTDSAMGRPLGLVLPWRSMDPGVADPSWHWVSGLAGQALVLKEGKTLILNHGLVATEALPGMVEVGTLIDKLTYHPAPRPGPENWSLPDYWDDFRVKDFAGGRWRGAGIDLALDAGASPHGAVRGHIRAAGEDSPCIGFIDPQARETKSGLQAVTLARHRPGNGTVEVMFGSLDRAGATLSLMRMESRATAVHASYLQTSIDQLVLGPA